MKLILTDTGPNKLQVIKLITDTTNMSLRWAKVLADEPPSLIKKNMSYADAHNLRADFEKVDAKVKLLQDMDLILLE